MEVANHLLHVMTPSRTKSPLGATGDDFGWENGFKTKVKVLCHLLCCPDLDQPIFFKCCYLKTTHACWWWCIVFNNTSNFTPTDPRDNSQYHDGPPWAARKGRLRMNYKWFAPSFACIKALPAVSNDVFGLVESFGFVCGYNPHCSHCTTRPLFSLLMDFCSLWILTTGKVWWRTDGWWCGGNHLYILDNCYLHWEIPPCT